MIIDKYPYTNLHELNLDWIIEKIKELTIYVETVEENILAQAKAYTDEELAGYQDQLNSYQAQINNQIAQFQDTVNNLLTIQDSKIQAFDRKIDDAIIGVNARTDLAIEQNNDYLMEQISQGLIDIKVVNYFTGALVSVQEMFDYLAHFHLENAISYAELAAASKTYTEFAAYYMTYTTLANSGKTIIV